ncbi:MAG: ImmA/IrrE family metallo-endopeptidase [Phycisphaerae bacterium]|nr:ImmA/IrrE family metallo-endopeptidase [Phycisphaerae bacterium]
MERSLNLPVLKDALIKAGMNQSALAEELKVSREAVSKWFNGASFPTPDKLLRIGVLLGLAFEQLVVSSASAAVPIVSFRRKAARKTRDVHLDNARETGELLKRLVKYLPTEELTQPPTLKNPENDYDYLQRVAADVRKEMGVEDKAIIQFEDLIAKFDRLHAILVPVLWGAKEYHSNALNIHLPDSRTTWVFLNLDSSGVDFKFWMAHELGHALAPTLGGEAGEDFADGFAQALLFPEPHAVALYRELEGIRAVGVRINAVQTRAAKHVISPYTIRLALEGYERAKGLAHIDLGVVAGFMGATKNFARRYGTITRAVFGAESPSATDYIGKVRKVFGGSFFDALAGFCRVEQGAEHFIRQVLGVSLADAKALSGALCG